MEKSPFEILGIDDSVTQSELYDAYKAARAVYADKRFTPGAEGEEACEKLDEIETAYREADRILQERYFVSNAKDIYAKFDEYIKSDKLEDAQRELDRLVKRDAEWHYRQSMIYYKKGWLTDAEEQLKVATEEEPLNAKYSDSLKSLKEKMTNSGKHHSERAESRGNYNREYDGRSYRDMGDGDVRVRGCTPCDCCSSLLCADCCCECMGGDLISCC